jgi:hypothetical protein
LRNEHIGAEGAAQVAKALRYDRGCTTITSLRLSGNAIGNAGATHLAEALIAGTPIKNLDLRSNRIGNAGVEKLAAAVRSLSSLDLWFNLSITQDGLNHLANALEDAVNLTWLRSDIDHPGIVEAVACNRARFLVLSVYVTNESISFVSLGGKDILTLDAEQELLSLKETGEKLAASVGVGISRLRIAMEDGRLISPIDEPRSVAELVRNETL